MNRVGSASSRSPSTPSNNVEGSWQLDLPDEDGNRRVVYLSSKHGEMDPLVFSTLIPRNLPDHLISDITIQAIRHAPTRILPNILGLLSCTYTRETMQRRSKVTSQLEEIAVVDISLLRRVVSSEGKSVCGCVFKKGDLVWTCRNCAKDPTCVQCDPCFRKSNHKGHEVYFHRAGGDSGCCDCGDPEAWSKQGNCTDHQCKSADHDPSAQFPGELKRSFGAVVQGILTITAEYAIIATRGLESFDNNIVLQLMERFLPMNNLVARVHNDDVHTFDQVIQALRSFGMNEAEARHMTEKVDKDGAAKVLADLPNSDRLRSAHQKLKENAKLIFSIIPEEIFALEEKIMVALKWACGLGFMSEGFRRLICLEFFKEVGTTESHSIPILDKQPYQQWRLCDAFADGDTIAAQFPSEITQVDSIEMLHLMLSGRCSVSSTNLAGSYPEEEIDYSKETEFKERVRYPFNYCHRNILSILSMATPFLSLPLKKWLHDVIMRFQHDRLFKSGFSQIITTIYPSLAMLYCRHYGVSDDSIFRTTVQLYTAHSVVDQMSSSGALHRILPEGRNRHLTITTMLANTLYAILADLGKEDQKVIARLRVEGTTPLSDNNSHHKERAFLTHHSIRTNRVSVVCRDFEYLTSNSFFCTKMLLNEINPGTVESWIDVCRMIQELDKYQRLTAHHVENEDDVWQYGANLAIEVETVTTHLISNSLLDPSLSSIENEFHGSNGSAQGSSEKMEQEEPSESLSFDTLQQMRENALVMVTKKTVGAVLDYYKNLQQEVDTTHNIAGDITLTRLPFQVSKDSISVHIPLHRFYLKSFMYAAYGNVSCQGALSCIRCLPNSSKRILFDWPLRCLSFSSQVTLQMWRRNGYAVGNLAFNYGRIPLSRALRDLDLLAMQIAILTNSSVDRILLMMADRFEILQLIDSLQEYESDRLCEYRPKLISEFLRTLIHIFTYLPVALLENSSSTYPVSVEGIERAVKREVFHQVLSGNNSLSSLAKVKAMVGQSQRTVSDHMLLNAVNDLCQSRAAGDASANMSGNPGNSAGGEEGTKLQLLDNSFRFFDPEYINMSSKNALPSCDRVRDRMKAMGTTLSSLNAGSAYHDNPFVPLFQIDALPLPHRDFTTVRELLATNQRFVEILHRCMQISWNNSESSAGFNRSSIIGRVIHLVTLQIHQHTINPQSFSLASIYCENNQAGWSLLHDLCLTWQKGIFKDDILYHQGLGFVLHHLSLNVSGIDEIVHRYGFTRIIGESVEDEKKRLRKEAQAKALEETKRKAEEAMKLFGSEMSDDDDDGDENTGIADFGGGTVMDTEDCIGESFSAKKIKLAETCIVCREKDKENDAMGYLCFLQTSNVNKNTLLNRTELVDPLSKVYRVTALDGCICRSERSEASASVGFIPYNESVVVEERKECWMRISAPHSGWIKLFKFRPTHQPALGINSTAKRSPFIVNVLHPVKDFLFNKSGGTRVHISTCGHAMHFGCWDLVYASSCARSVNGQRTAHDFAIDVMKGECLCPLCKAVSNTILPLEDLRLNKNSLVGFEQDSDNEESDFPTESTPTALSFSEIMNSYGEMSSIHSWLKRCIRKYRVKNSIRFRDERFHSNLLAFQSALHVADNDVRSIQGLTMHEIEGWFHGNMRALRCFFGTSSAIAHTINNMSNRNLRHWALGLEHGIGTTAVAANSWKVVESDYNMSRQLLGLVSRMSSLFSKDLGMYHRMLISPVLSLMLGKDHTISPSTSSKAIQRSDPNLVSQWRHLLRTLPFQAVHSVDFPDLPTVFEVLQQARATFDATSEDDNATPVPDVEELFSSELWGFSHGPLLTQDLSVFAIVLYGLLENEAAYKASLLLILVAKVCQLLLEPEATGLDAHACNGSNDSADMQKKRPKFQATSNLELEFVQLSVQLRLLQEHLCRDANTPLASTHASSSRDDSELLLYVCNGLVPFLEYLCRIHELVGLPVYFEDAFTARDMLVQQTKDDRALVGSVFQLMKAIHFPDLSAILESALTKYLGQVWANDLKSYFPKRPSDQEVKWVPQESPADASRVNQPTDSAVVEHSSGEIGDADADMDDSHHFHDAIEGLDDEMEDNDVPELESDNDEDYEDDEDEDGDEEGLIEALINNPPQDMGDLLIRVRAILDRAQGGAANLGDIHPLLQQLFQVLGPGFMQNFAANQNDNGAAAVATTPPTPVATRSSSAIRSSNRHSSQPDPIIDWKQYGVLPVNGAIDELMYDEYKNLSTVIPHFHTPLQGAITGSYPILSLTGAPLPYVFPDLSHRTLSYRQIIQNCLISLPNLYTDLYHTAKFPEGPEGITIDDPVVCLVCGTVLNAGRRVSNGAESSKNPGECTIHAERCGAGVGVFFLLHQCQVLLIRSARAIYYPSIYLDESGETNESGFQNKPMYLSQKRYRKLEELYIGHQVGKEVARKRVNSDSVIRQFWH